MIKQILVCDRCGAETEIAYRIKMFTITPDDTIERDGRHLGENTDYCPACLRTIATLADTAPLPDVAAEMQREPEPEPEPGQEPETASGPEAPPEPELTVPDSEQVEQVEEAPAEDPVEFSVEPAPKRCRAKTLYLMKQAGKSIDQIAEETGYTPEEVYKKIEKFKKDGGRRC